MMDLFYRFWKIARRLHAGSVSRTVIATVLARYRIA
jgi:hypothetical protein